jgi:hypothetical protein
VTSSRLTPLTSRTDVGVRAKDNCETGVAGMSNPLAVSRPPRAAPPLSADKSTNAEKIRPDYVGRIAAVFCHVQMRLWRP